MTVKFALVEVTTKPDPDVSVDIRCIEKDIDPEHLPWDAHALESTMSTMMRVAKKSPTTMHLVCYDDEYANSISDNFNRSVKP